MKSKPPYQQRRARPAHSRVWLAPCIAATLLWATVARTASEPGAIRVEPERHGPAIHQVGSGEGVNASGTSNGTMSGPPGGLRPGARKPGSDNERPADAVDDASRGRMLYENHCTACHTSLAHVRENHKADSLDDLRGWVARWQTQLDLPWTVEEQTDVVNYLNRRFYHFEQPR
ncbi:MAG: hypothetical protein KDK91_00735 [Gammaproteobacteria bacterium]|nr:hypothetical protein [Gammaproteobacteria bacterium]